MIDNKKTSDYIKQNQDAVERQYDKGGHSFIIIYYVWMIYQKNI